MKYKRIKKKDAEHIIVYGTNKGFTMLKDMTIYHRIFAGEWFDIGTITIMTGNESESIDVFYRLEPDEIDLFLNRNKQDREQEINS